MSDNTTLSDAARQLSPQLLQDARSDTARGWAGQRGPLIGRQLPSGIYLTLKPRRHRGTCGVGLVGVGHRP
jgi:hypothetical protein